jgi:hypothetical protein
VTKRLPFFAPVSKLLVATAFLALTGSAFAGTPQWVRDIARTQLPAYDAETHAAVLLNEQIVNVNADGNTHTIHRYAVKILRESGRDHGAKAVYFDSDTKLTYFKGWTITASGQEYEVKEKDALEASIGSGVLYDDNRTKVMKMPGSDPGSVVAWEYEQKERPYTFQDLFFFQEDIPVKTARLTVNLPAGWEVKSYFVNYPEAKSSGGGSSYTWEMTDVPGLKHEPGMPSMRSVMARLGVNFIAPGNSEKSHASWKDVGTWYYNLAMPRRNVTPEIQQTVQKLTAGKTTVFDKVRALGAFAQRDVRYVAIEIGIGGHQPHFATDIFANKYGDCKDKVTLLGSMLKEAGLESNYVLVNTTRGLISPTYPTHQIFNHVIIAVQIPESEKLPPDGSYSLINHPKLGRLLIFDPTDDMTRVGMLPTYLQGDYGLLVTQSGGELVDLPLQPPDANQLRRTAKLTLAPTGELSGEVVETRTGSNARDYRARMLAMDGGERKKFFEGYLGLFLNGSALQDFSMDNLEDYDKDLVIHFKFTSKSYAKSMGSLLLVRPRVFGSKADYIVDLKDRKYGLELDAPTLQTDDFVITLPDGFTADELPPAIDLKSSYGGYTSKTSFEGHTLSYTRQYRVDKVAVSRDKLDDANAFSRKIVADEKNAAILKKQ